MSLGLCISSTRKPVSHLTGLCKSLRNLRDKPAAALALPRWDVPRRELERPRRQRLCFPTGQSKTILFTSVFQLSEQNYLLHFCVSVLLVCLESSAIVES